MKRLSLTDHVLCALAEILSPVAFFVVVGPAPSRKTARKSASHLHVVKRLAKQKAFRRATKPHLPKRG